MELLRWPRHSSTVLLASVLVLVVGLSPAPPAAAGTHRLRTQLVSVDSDEHQLSDGEWPSITPDGRSIVFTSSGRIMLRDRQAGTTTSPDVAEDGGEPNG